MDNPFKYGTIARGIYFADRQNEIAELQHEMVNLNRVFLVSPRRFGKTCLLFNLIDNLKQSGVACAYIDLNAYPDIRSLSAALTSAALTARETNTDKLLKLISGFQRLRPKVSVDREGTISAGVELGLDEKEPLAALLEGLGKADRLAAKKKKKLAVIIDEFSDIEKYDGNAIEKALRSEIQTHHHLGYILAGSEQSVMLAMTRDPKRAFYKMGRMMELGPIKRKAYTKFIKKWLKKGGFKYNAEGFVQIFNIADDVPYNIQRLCHVMWNAALDTKRIEPSLINTLPHIIARQDAPHYEMVWRTASQAQKIVLIALSEDTTAQPFSKVFQFTHGIGPSSSIKASLDSLIKKGILYQSLKGQYRFTDLFMPFWIEAIRQPDR